MPSKSSIQLSVETARTVRGQEIKRLKLGEFLKVYDEIYALASGVISAFLLNGRVPGGQAVDDIPLLSEQTIHLACKLMGIDEAKMMGDPQVGIAGIYEMLHVWIELNGVDQLWGGGTKSRRRASSKQDKLPPTEFWVQRLIMQMQDLGISKEQLLGQFYYDEINVLLDEWSILHGSDSDWEEEVSPQAFLSM